MHTRSPLGVQVRSGNRRSKYGGRKLEKGLREVRVIEVQIEGKHVCTENGRENIGRWKWGGREGEGRTGRRRRNKY